jgi:hypothetical protein
MSTDRAGATAQANEAAIWSGTFVFAFHIMKIIFFVTTATINW